MYFKIQFTNININKSIKMNHLRNILLFSLFILLLTSCATTPVVQVAQPWTRIMGDTDQISTGTKIFLDISGEENHLLLDNAMLNNHISTILSEQLERRAFELTSDANEANFFFSLVYSSNAVQVMRNSVSTYQTSSQSAATRSGAGVFAAMTVSAIASRNETITSSDVRTTTAYRHTLGIEITDAAKIVIWTGESTWEDNRVDIIGRFPFVSGILLSYLPGYGDVIPRIEAVQENRSLSYFSLYFEGNRFSVPSLPFPILVGGPANTGPVFGGSGISRSTSALTGNTIQGVSDPRILHAVYDLIQTAEFALPQRPNYRNPLDIEQWRRVRLGGIYYVGNDTEVTYIIVELRGSTNGYSIQSANAVNLREYNSFIEDLGKWQNALSNYFDFFE